MQSIANNSGAIIVALIGLLGTIIGIVVKMRADKAEEKKKL
jgi:biopolymer transport protein ExbB/TolQ